MLISHYQRRIQITPHLFFEMVHATIAADLKLWSHSDLGTFGLCLSDTLDYASGVTFEV